MTVGEDVNVMGMECNANGHMLNLYLDAKSTAQDTEHALPALAVPANMRSASICAMQCSKGYLKAPCPADQAVSNSLYQARRLGVFFLSVFCAVHICQAVLTDKSKS